jgi:hypothetical protein
MTPEVVNECDVAAAAAAGGMATRHLRVRNQTAPMYIDCNRAMFLRIQSLFSNVILGGGATAAMLHSSASTSSSTYMRMCRTQRSSLLCAKLPQIKSVISSYFSCYK